MPIFRLHRLFGIKNAIENPPWACLSFVGDEERRCALLVDELLGQQQVVAKSLTRLLVKSRVFPAAQSSAMDRSD